MWNPKAVYHEVRKWFGWNSVDRDAYFQLSNEAGAEFWKKKSCFSGEGQQPCDVQRAVPTLPRLAGSKERVEAKRPSFLVLCCGKSAHRSFCEGRCTVFDNQGPAAWPPTIVPWRGWFTGTCHFRWESGYVQLAAISSEAKSLSYWVLRWTSWQKYENFLQQYVASGSLGSALLSLLQEHFLRIKS